MRMPTRLKFALLLGSLLLAPAVNADFVIDGKIYDGSASMVKIRGEGLREGSWKVPLADLEIEVRGLKAGAEKSWKVTTGKDGSFRIPTGLDSSAAGAPFAAIARTPRGDLYTRSFDGGEDKPFEIFAYPASDDPDRVRASTKIYHTIVKEIERSPSGKIRETYYLKVQATVELVNLGDSIYIGRKDLNGDPEVYRLPIPAGADIIRNEGPVEGTRMRISPDGRHLVADEPVAGLLELMEAMGGGEQQQPEIPGWKIEYRLPASDLFTMKYAQSHTLMGRAEGRPPGFLVYVEEGKMQISPTLSQLQKLTTLKEGPLGGPSKSFDVYAPRADEKPGPGTWILVPVEISDVAVGEVSEKALLWHGGTIAIVLLAVLSGLALGRRRGSFSSGEGLIGGQQIDVIDQIATLDAQLAAGAMPAEEHRRRREVLVEIAVGELDQGYAGKQAAAPASGISSSARKLMARIAELDEKKEPGVEEAQERAHLLESLYKSLKNDQGT